MNCHLDKIEICSNDQIMSIKPKKTKQKNLGWVVGMKANTNTDMKCASKIILSIVKLSQDIIKSLHSKLILFTPRVSV